jgi:Ca-activated chloride channel homolog
MNKKIIALSLAINLTGCSFFSANNPIAPSNIEPRTEEVQPTTKDELYTTYQAEKLKSSEPKSDNLAKAAPATMGGMSFSDLASSPKKMFFSRESEGGVNYQYYENNESYDKITENEFHKGLKEPLSTFSIDVDTASYSNIRRMINQGVLPNKDAIRVEELINYFNYDYTPPKDGAFSVNMEVAPALWNKKHRVVRIGIKGKEIQVDKRPASNLVFLIDVSGSMDTPEKLPLVKSALGMLTDKLNENDKISIVVYAGAAGLVLPPTSGEKKIKS